MKVTTSKSKNSESVYITKNELLKEHGPTRDDVNDILRVSEGRWEIEECFKIMKTDFEARLFFTKQDTY